MLIQLPFAKHFHFQDSEKADLVLFPSLPFPTLPTLARIYFVTFVSLELFLQVPKISFSLFLFLVNLN